MNMVSKETRATVESAIAVLIAKANDLYVKNPTWAEASAPLMMPKVTYNLGGGSAGRANSTTWTLGFHPVLLSENLEEFLNTTIPHEVAHLIHSKTHIGEHRGLTSNSRGVTVCCRRDVHGSSWKSIMRDLGYQPRTCHNYDMTNVKRRRAQRIEVECPRCHTSFEITSVRLSRMQNGTSYRHKCGELVDSTNLIIKTRTLPERKPVNTMPTPKAPRRVERSKIDTCRWVYEQHNASVTEEKLVEMFAQHGKMQCGQAKQYLKHIQKEHA